MKLGTKSRSRENTVSHRQQCLPWPEAYRQLLQRQSFPILIPGALGLVFAFGGGSLSKASHPSSVATCPVSLKKPKEFVTRDDLDFFERSGGVSPIGCLDHNDTGSHTPYSSLRSLCSYPLLPASTSRRGYPTAGTLQFMRRGECHRGYARIWNRQ